MAMRSGPATWALAGLALLASGSPRAQDVLADDFDGAGFSESGRLFYKKNAEQAAGAIRFQSEVVRSGTGALQLSVGESCPKDDADCSERAEVWEKPSAHVPYLQGAWYGFSVKFGDPVPQDDHRYLIAQWKREILPGAAGDFSPLLALRLGRGKLFATVETGPLETHPAGAAGCADGETPVFAAKSRTQVRALVAAQADWSAEDGRLFKACTAGIRVVAGDPLPAPASGWIDFAIYSRPAPRGGGRIEIIANGARVASVSGQIGHEGEGLGADQYFKFGPYRAGGAGVWTMYYDTFRRGPRCEDVTEAKNCPPGVAFGGQ